MKKTYDFEVRQMIRGEYRCVAHFASLNDACEFAYKLNMRTRERVFVVRIDVEPLSFFDNFPESIKTLNKK